MNKATEILIQEHNDIILMLRVIERILKRLKAGEEVKKDHLRRIVEFLQNFADKCHHGKEEDILFPDLVENAQTSPLVNELMGEHKTGRDLVLGISKSIDGFRPANPHALHIATNSEFFRQLLMEHIRKENMVLFPQAEEILPPENKKGLEEKFIIADKNIISPKQREEYRAWLGEFKAIYLS